LPISGRAQRALLAMMAMPADRRDGTTVVQYARDQLAVWRGPWQTRRGTFTVHFDDGGATIVPMKGQLFDRRGGQMIVETVTEQRLTGRWQIVSQNLEGTFTWTLKPGNRQFDGRYSEKSGAAETADWWGERR